MPKPHVSHTLGQLHFEDLDPHRFEDLIRQLTYDFRQWQSIESTGRGGADDGFDIRAFEVVTNSLPSDTDPDDEEEVPHPMEGNLWMIQCKREKQLGPKRVQSIIEDSVDAKNPPHGYILAAPANFSKKAHDRFREELRARGVMEFYLWGAGELEDMLYQPKNDRVLFAFFGVSLVTRRRSRTTEVRATVTIKNKLMRILGERPSNQPVLLRDIGDSAYPYETKYDDFDVRPRWKEYAAIEIHPLGLILSVGKYYAYGNEDSNEWDYSKAVNLVRSNTRRSRSRGSDENQELSVKGCWEKLRHSTRARFIRNGLVRFDSILLVDDKGDIEYECPHLYVDFDSERGPFWGYAQYLELSKSRTLEIDSLKRVDTFPDEFPSPSFGSIYSDRQIMLDERSGAMYQPGSSEISLYRLDNEFAFLSPDDVIGVEGVKSRDSEKHYIKVTNNYEVKGKELLDSLSEDPLGKEIVENQIGRKVKSRDIIFVTEALAIYDFQIEQNRPVI